MKPFTSTFTRNPCGFGLVEVMVAMVIGMLGILVMLQVFQLSEGQKRRTTGGGDAMNGGAMALYNIQRDIRQAGYGISNYSMLGCGLSYSTPGGAAVTLPALAPITIYTDPANNGGSMAAANPDAGTDVLLVIYGNTAGSPQGDGVSAQPSNTVMTVNTPSAFANGDRVIAMPLIRPTPCNLVLDSVTKSGAYPVAPDIASSNITLGGGLGGMNKGTLYNLGSSPRVIAYAIKGGNLTACDYRQNDCSDAGNAGDSSVWVPIANNIVSMRAMYGHDTGLPTMNGYVSQWDQTAPTTQCGWARISAVNIALVARNTQFEKTAVTIGDPQWIGSVANAPAIPTAIPIDVSGYGYNYRYKVFQTVVPLRNVVWMGKVC